MDISRAFIALPFASHAATLLHVSAHAESASQRLRWVAADNLHLTLAFIGGLSAAQVYDTCTVIGAVAARCKGFDISFTRVSLFPEGRHPRVLAALPKHSDDLRKLQSALAQGLQTLAIYKQERTYCPHVTLARCTQASAEIKPVTIDLDYTAAELHLYQSEQTGVGVRYRSLCSAALIH